MPSIWIFYARGETFTYVLGFNPKLFCRRCCHTKFSSSLEFGHNSFEHIACEWKRESESESGFWIGITHLYDSDRSFGANMCNPQHAPTSFNLPSYPTMPSHCRRIATRQFHICRTHVLVRPDLIRHRIISIDSRCLCSIFFPLRPHLNWMSLSLEVAPLFCYSPKPEKKMLLSLFSSDRHVATRQTTSNRTWHRMPCARRPKIFHVCGFIDKTF